MLSYKGADYPCSSAPATNPQGAVTQNSTECAINANLACDIFWNNNKSAMVYIVVKNSNSVSAPDGVSVKAVNTFEFHQDFVGPYDPDPKNFVSSLNQILKDNCDRDPSLWPAKVNRHIYSHTQVISKDGTSLACDHNDEVNSDGEILQPIAKCVGKNLTQDHFSSLSCDLTGSEESDTTAKLYRFDAAISVVSGQKIASNITRTPPLDKQPELNVKLGSGDFETASDAWMKENCLWTGVVGSSIPSTQNPASPTVQ
jgi:hypothetical protein